MPQSQLPIIEYGKEFASRRRRSPFLNEYRPTFGVLLAIPALLASFVTIGATIDAGRHLFPLSYDAAAAFGRCAVALAVSVFFTIIAFRWICEAGEMDDADK